ncbi:MAG TPA: AMP-binding protein, partial [Chloroflexota bacterium]|nr:AMP-binding protein [Chloroflexota bacterium]
MAGSIDAGAISYEQRRASVQLDVPERFNFTADVFEPWADTDAVAMLWFDDNGAERRISYRELSERANRLANVLRSQGVSKGDRVFIMVGRIPEWW